MAYEKQTWVNGDIITEEKMNHIEDGIANVGADYDCGYECIETRNILFEGEVTTSEDQGHIFAPIDFEDPETETLILTIDDVEYTLNRFLIGQYDAVIYAESIDRSDPQNPVASVPCISIDVLSWIETETVGDHSVVIAALVTSIEVTDDFRSAVAQIIAGGYVLICTRGENGALNHTWQEIADAGFAVLRDDYSGGGYRILYLWQVVRDTHSVLFFNGIDETLTTIDCITFTASSADDYPVYVSPTTNDDPHGK